VQTLSLGRGRGKKRGRREEVEIGPETAWMNADKYEIPFYAILTRAA
jgi:hypothetical protein